MKLKRILCLTLSFAAVACMFLVRDSVAWIDTSSGQPLSQDITARNMYFVFEGSLGTNLDYESLTGVTEGVTGEYIIPGQNLIVDNSGKLTGINYSTIDTEIRVLVTYDADTSSGSPAEYTGLSDDIVVEFPEGWTKGVSDNYFAPSGELPALTPAQVTAGTGVSFDIINGVYYNVDEAYASLNAELTITVQVKQADYVNWSTLRTWVATLP